MSGPRVPVPRRVRPSVSQRGLAPELGIAAATVAATTVVHWALLLRVEQKPPLILFAATAVALTFWRGLGPGMLASSLGTAVGSSLFVVSPNQYAALKTDVPLETLLWFGGTMFSCWLVYRVRADREDADTVQARRNDALAFVSHELRQPLSNIQLAAAILERDSSDRTRDRAAALIRRSAARLGRMIDDLADITLLEASAIRIDAAEMTLQDALLTAADAARPAMEQRQQLFTIDVPPDPPLVVVGDAVRLQQVFANVLGNASKYSPESGEISLSCREREGRAVVVVRDTGLGVRPDMLDAIFDPFVREPGRGHDGLGLGLTLARDLVERHGGTISAHSDGPGRGSAFTIQLPLAAAPARSLAPPPPHPTGSALS